MGDDPDLRVVNEGAAAAGGVAGGAELVAFADALLGSDDAALASARAALVGAVGADGASDAAAVVGNFQRMNRIADAIGIPIDGGAGALTSGIQEELDLRRFSSASHSAESTALQRSAARVLAKILPVVGRLLRRKD